MTASRDEYLPGNDGAAISEREGVDLVSFNRPLDGIGHSHFNTLFHSGKVNDQVESLSPEYGVSVYSGGKFETQFSQ